MGKQARRDIGRAPVVAGSPLGPPPTGVLLGQLRGDQVRVIGVEQFKALGDAPVQQPSLRRADLTCVYAVSRSKSCEKS